MSDDDDDNWSSDEVVSDDTLVSSWLRLVFACRLIGQTSSSDHESYGSDDCNYLTNLTIVVIRRRQQLSDVWSDVMSWSDAPRLLVSV